MMIYSKDMWIQKWGHRIGKAFTGPMDKHSETKEGRMVELRTILGLQWDDAKRRMER